MRISLAEHVREISQVAPRDLDPDEPDGPQPDQATAADDDYLLDLGYPSLFLFSARFLTRPSQPVHPSQGAGQSVGPQIRREACVKNTVARWRRAISSVRLAGRGLRVGR